MKNQLDISGINADVTRGVRRVVEYEKIMESNEPSLPDFYASDAIFDIIKGVSDDDKQILSMTFEEIASLAFSELGYNFDVAEDICARLTEINEKTPTEKILKVLRDFDEASLCLSDMTVYPSVLMNSLSRIELWLEQFMFPELSMDIIYILSYYDALMNSRAYKVVLKQEGYKDFKKNGFLSPDERDFLKTRKVDLEMKRIEDFLTGDNG